MVISDELGVKMGIINVNAAVLFRKPWSKFKPDFYIETVD
jgi:hypothetical protein